MPFLRWITFFLCILVSGFSVRSDYHEMVGWILTEFSKNFAVTMNVLVFACTQNNLLQVAKNVGNSTHLLEIVSVNENNAPEIVLTRKSYRKTAIMIDSTCIKSNYLLTQASIGRYLNKTYQWFLWSLDNKNVEEIVPSGLNYFGPNSQVTVINRTNSTIEIWSVYSKGKHLLNPLNFSLIEVVVFMSPFTKIHNVNICKNILKAQHARNRNQFHGLVMRGVTVIDIDNISSNTEIIAQLSKPGKLNGISAFTKYYFEVVQLLKDYLNFTIVFRAARGWAGRLDNTSYRLGFLGIMARNEADIGASGAFNRINRFAEFDIIHQGWKFETAFLYRFVPSLSSSVKAGSFLIPFQRNVWIFMMWLIITIIFVFWLLENIRLKMDIYKHPIPCNKLNSRKQIYLANALFVSIAAICQQGVNPISRWEPIRIVIFSTFIFSVLILNYYTSSVVSALLSSPVQGPANIEEIISSSLKVSFEDAGYYKVLFKENKSPIILRLITQKLLPPRKEHDLAVYTSIKKAMPLIKGGSYAFHCELADAFPEILKSFDANELCTLRVVKGLMNTELMNGILHKNSQYTELFRFTLSWAREVGLIARISYNRQRKQPLCQTVLTVFPVNFSNVSGQCFLLYGGALLSALTLFSEVLSHANFICA